MDSVLRALTVYLFLLVVFRLLGKRSLGQATTFDFVLVLVISQAVQNALLGYDYSVTNGFVIVLTIVVVDLSLSLLKRRFPLVSRWVEGLPLVVIEEGALLADRMKSARIDEGDVLEAARRLRGIGNLDEIRFAVVERDGDISIIPKPRS
jgi:uncharacterized membrane protein YcaP (DUF421 family)